MTKIRCQQECYIDIKHCSTAQLFAELIAQSEATVLTMIV
jgi:hypothetical protein